MSHSDLPGEGSHLYSTVVIGVDPSATALHARREAFKLARAMGSHVHLVAAFSDGPDGATRVSDERRKAEAMLEAAACDFDATYRHVTTHALPWKAARAITDVATRVNADLIVVGNKGAHSARRALGSVAGAVTHEAPCTVMVVRTT